MKQFFKKIWKIIDSMISDKPFPGTYEWVEQKVEEEKNANK